MTDTRYLVHGVFWPAADDSANGAPPVLRLQAPDGTFQETALDDGTRLGIRLAAEGKSCLGHHRVHGPARRDHILCAGRLPSARGHQCERCFVADDFRLMHDFHRDGRVPPGLRSYLMQPHWLYIATFADGASKVGTASNLRKWQRLAEQGAVVASYVARAADGRIVRILEDLVTRDCGLPQQVRSAAKASALAGPAPAGRLTAHNLTLAATARQVIPARAWKVSRWWTRPGAGPDWPGGCVRQAPGTPTPTAWLPGRTASPSSPSAAVSCWPPSVERTSNSSWTSAGSRAEPSSWETIPRRSRPCRKPCSEVAR